MSKKLSDVTEQEILDFRKDIAKIESSTTMTNEEKIIQVKTRTKIMLRDFSYIDLFDALKSSKLKGNLNKKFGACYEAAIEELLDEKKKILSMAEIDNVLEHLKQETNKTKKFIDETRGSLSE